MLLRNFILERYYDTTAEVREQTGLCGEVDFYHELKTETEVLKTMITKSTSECCFIAVSSQA